MRTVAALFVATRGCYFGLPDVDPWDEERDARLYPGPHPAVAHPPCARWSMLAGLVQARWGHKKGDDGGCFASALASVRAYGGVLEHPAYSAAWKAHSLPRPAKSGGWVQGACGGYSAHVEQGNYGHRARKATWLYAYGTARPDLLWGPSQSTVWVSYCNNHSSGKVVERMGKRESLATPPAFRDLLLLLARSVPV